jgi:trimeric autotransporter adhesin
MAATGYTPISLYYSTTATIAPSAGSLVAGELAINTLDEKLYFKNSTGTVKLLASSASSTGTVSSVAQSFTGGIVSVGGSPITTSGTLALTVAGTSGGIPYFSTSSAWASSAALTQYGIVYGGGAGATPVATAAGTTGQVLTATTGSAPTWASAAAQVYPGAGIANSTGTAWGTSYTTSGTGTVAVLATTPTITTPVLTNPTITAYLETAPAIANSGTATTLALASGTVLSYTLNGNCTFTMPTATNGTSFIVRLIQDATGGRTATFTGVKWPGGTVPTITTTASSGVDIISFVCIASVWYGNAAQAFA